MGLERDHVRRRTGREGFTLVEMLLVMAFGAILATVVGPSLGTIQARLDTRSSRDAFLLFAARARAAALDRGAVSTLTVDPDAGVARLSVGAEALDSIRFQQELGIEVRTSTGDALVVCYSSRGFALASCTDVADDVRVEFVRGNETAAAVVQPLGQVRKVGA